MDEQEWDEFAPEYYFNQLESQTTIVKDVIAYLKSNEVLPTQRIVDIAGGAGRYLPLAKEAGNYELIDFSNKMLKFAEVEASKIDVRNIRLTKQSFNDFLKNKNEYDLIFSAANPALDNTEKLGKLLNKMKKACVILRVIDSKDNLFYPLEKQLGIFEEDPTTSPDLMDQFEKYLEQKKYSYHIKEFTYDIEEEIPRFLMVTYYEEYKKDQRFIDYLNQHFKMNEQVVNTTRLTYRLLLIK